MNIIERLSGDGPLGKSGRGKVLGFLAVFNAGNEKLAMFALIKLSTAEIKEVKHYLAGGRLGWNKEAIKGGE